MIGKAALAAILLVGCAPVPEPGEGACDAGLAQHLVGRAATAELGAQALRLSGAGTFRWLPEGAIVTMEYRADRLNIQLDGGNRVAAIRCG